MIRIALIGCGSMGRNWLRVLRDNPRFEVVAVVDPVAPEATHTCPPSKCDATIVATPTMDRVAPVLMAIMCGARVLVEKPLAASVDTCFRLIEAANDHGVSLAVGHVERFNPAFVALQGAIRAGHVGAVQSVVALRVGPMPSNVAPGNNVSIDLAVHDVDLISMLIGPLRSLDRAAERDDATRNFRSLGGATATARSSWRSSTKERRITVTGDRGMMHCDLIYQTLHLCGTGDIHVTRAESLALQADAFADLIETGNYGRLATGLEAAAAVSLVT